MSVTVSSIVLLSMLLSLGGFVLFSWLTWSAWKRFRAHPCDRCSWMFLAVLALAWASATLLLTATGAWYRGGGGRDADVLSLLNHIAFMLRGGLIAFAISLVYGWRKIDQEAN